MKQTVFFEEVLHYDEFTGTGGGGIVYPNFRVLDKAQAKTTVYFKWGTYSKSLVFAAADDTITRADGGSFVEDGIKVGDTLTIAGSGSNDGDVTVEEVSETEISVTEALVEEVVTCSLHGVTPITYVDYQYNILSNKLAADFYSPIDINSICEYYKTGLDCTDNTPVAMTASGRSQAWNNTESITIEGSGSIVDYAQKFIIRHTYRVSPYWLVGQDTNFENIVPPDYTDMKFVSKVGSSFDENNPNFDHSGVYDVGGRIGWFNQSERGVSNYTATSITCDDDDFDFNTETTWSAVLTSDALFTAATRVSVAFFRCPSNESDYIFTSTNQRKNFMLDHKFLQVGSMNNGENYGTDYQVLVDVDPVLTNASTITIGFKINLATALKTILAAADPEDRKFAIAITTQNQAITTTAETDRACTLFAFENFGYNQDDATGIQLVDYIRCYQFPNRGTEPKNSFVMFPNEPGYADVPFTVKVNETLISASMQIVATKSGQDDFVLEEKEYTTENIRSLDGAQTIDMDDSRELNTYEGDYYNEVYLRRMPAYDTELVFGMIFHYGFIARYEDWLQALPLSDAQGIDVARSIEDLNQLWYNFDQSGWDIKIRFNATKEDSNGVQTDYYAQTLVEMVNYGSATYPVECTCALTFFDEDDVEIDGIESGAVTKIVATFTGDLTAPANFEGLAAFLRIDMTTIGGTTFSKYCTAEWNSETTSPFSSEGIDAGDGALDSYASNNARFDVYSGSVVISTYYDDTVDYWSRKGELILIFPTLKYKGDTTDCPITHETTEIPILDETNFAILAEGCP